MSLAACLQEQNVDGYLLLLETIGLCMFVVLFIFFFFFPGLDLAQPGTSVICFILGDAEKMPLRVRFSVTFLCQLFSERFGGGGI